MAALCELPPWSTTGVGSLPYADGRTAVARAVGDYDLRREGQIARALTELACRRRALMP